MDRYRRMDKPKPDVPIEENEVRIMATGKMRNYITYASSLLEEKNMETVVLKGMGRAINKTVTIVEIVKRRVVCYILFLFRFVITTEGCRAGCENVLFGMLLAEPGSERYTLLKIPPYLRGFPAHPTKLRCLTFHTQ